VASVVERVDDGGDRGVVAVEKLDQGGGYGQPDRELEAAGPRVELVE